MDKTKNSLHLWSVATTGYNLHMYMCMYTNTHVHIKVCMYYTVQVLRKSNSYSLPRCAAADIMVDY